MENIMFQNYCKWIIWAIRTVIHKSDEFVYRQSLCFSNFPFIILIFETRWTGLVRIELLFQFWWPRTQAGRTVSWTFVCRALRVVILQVPRQIVGQDFVLHPFQFPVEKFPSYRPAVFSKERQTSFCVENVFLLIRRMQSQNSQNHAFMKLSNKIC